jgi:hypothetical protein
LSKLGNIVAIPIALFALKALTGKIEDEEVEPILPEPPKGTAKDYEIKPFEIGTICLAGLPCGPAGTGPKPTGPAVPFGTGVDVVPFFPETAATADEVFPSDGTSDITKLKDFKFTFYDFEPFDPSKFPDLSKLAELQKKQSMEK